MYGSMPMGMRTRSMWRRSWNEAGLPCTRRSRWKRKFWLLSIKRSEFKLFCYVNYRIVLSWTPSERDPDIEIPQYRPRLVGIHRAQLERAQRKHIGKGQRIAGEKVRGREKGAFCNEIVEKHIGPAGEEYIVERLVPQRQHTLCDAGRIEGSLAKSRERDLVVELFGQPSYRELIHHAIAVVQVQAGLQMGLDRIPVGKGDVLVIVEKQPLIRHFRKAGIGAAGLRAENAYVGVLRKDIVGFRPQEEAPPGIDRPVEQVGPDEEIARDKIVVAFEFEAGRDGWVVGHVLETGAKPNGKVAVSGIAEAAIEQIVALVVQARLLVTA